MADVKKAQPTVPEALEAWREAERISVRSTAQREAADEALASAELAEKAARATAQAAHAAQIASAEAENAANATADAAAKVLAATRADQTAKQVVERLALAAEGEAREAHRDARDRVTRGEG